jgi:predicted transcriptional regulator
MDTVKSTAIRRTIEDLLKLDKQKGSDEIKTVEYNVLYNSGKRIDMKHHENPVVTYI